MSMRCANCGLLWIGARNHNHRQCTECGGSVSIGSTDRVLHVPADSHTAFKAYCKARGLYMKIEVDRVLRAVVRAADGDTKEAIAASVAEPIKEATITPLTKRRHPAPQHAAVAPETADDPWSSMPFWGGYDPLVCAECTRSIDVFNRFTIVGREGRFCSPCYDLLTGPKDEAL